MQSPSQRILNSAGEISHTSNTQMALCYALLKVIDANVDSGTYALTPCEEIVNVLTNAGVGADSRAIHYIRRHFREVT